MNLFLAFILLLQTLPMQMAEATPSMPPREFNVERDCKQGKCVTRLVELAKAKTQAARRDQCLPPIGNKDPKTWYENHSLTLSCVKQLKELEELHAKLAKVKTYLEQAEDGTCQDCKQGKTPADSLVSNIEDISRTTKVNTCTSEKSREVWSRAGDDLTCALASTAVGPYAMLLSTVRAKPIKIGSCNLANDNCYTQVILSFVKSVFTFLETIFDLAWKGVKAGASNMWTWLRGVEDQSSTAQLAAAKASEEDGFFQQLRKDFTGTMGKVWSGLMAGVKHWFSHQIFCEEWSGRPQFSDCKKPYQGLACTSVKNMMNGACALVGAIGSEVVPAFLTGGLFTAAKYGASGAAKIAKLIKVSPRLVSLAKGSQLGQKVALAASKASAVASRARAAKVVTAALSASKLALGALSKYLIAPTTVAVNSAIASVSQVAKTYGSYLMLTPAGPVMIVGTKVAKVAGKAVIFPIDNPLLNRSFQLGGDYFELLVKSAGAKASVIRNNIVGVESMRVIDKAYTEMKVAKTSSADENYLQVLQENRTAPVNHVLSTNPKIEFSQFVEEFFPELQYGKFAKLSNPKDVKKAESDIRRAIESMAPGADKDRLIKELDHNLASSARAIVVPEVQTFTQDQVFAHAILSDEDKLKKSFELLDIDPDDLTPGKLKRITEALKSSQNIGEGLFHYTSEQRVEILKLLTDSGLTPNQADLLLQAGYAGKIRPADSYPSLRSIIVPDVDVAALSSKTDYKNILGPVSVDRKPAVAKALKTLEDSGMNSQSAALTYNKFKPHFQNVQSKAGGNADAQALLAEFIGKQRKAGLADDVIQKKLDDTFGACK